MPCKFVIRDLRVAFYLVANITIFRPSSFYIIVHTNLGVQIVAQLTPFMQVYVALDPAYKGLTCGKFSTLMFLLLCKPMHMFNVFLTDK